MWSVSTVLQGLNGDLTTMKWLYEGDRFEAMNSAMSAMAQGDDVPWVKIVAINIERVES